MLIRWPQRLTAVSIQLDVALHYQTIQE